MNPRKRSPSILDILLLLAIIGLGSYFCYRLFFSLNYRWNWSIIPTYLFRFDPDSGHWTGNILLEGLLITLKLSAWGTLLAILLGFGIGLMRVSSRLLWKLLGRTYIEVIRNTPPLVLVFIFYYFISDQLLDLIGIEDLFREAPESIQPWLSLFLAEPSMIKPFLSGTLTLALFQGAYIAEIVRAGIQAIDKGQWESAKALGLTRWKSLRLVIMPQALKIMLPPLANEFINTIKWSSIVSIISIQELTFQGMQVIASTQATIEVWLTVSLMYLLICFSLSLAVRRLEYIVNRSGHTPPPATKC